MSKLQPRTKLYLNLGILFSIITILLVAGLSSWQGDSPTFNSTRDAIESLLFLSLLPGGFFLIGVGEHYGKIYFRVIGLAMILAEIIFFLA